MRKRNAGHSIALFMVLLPLIQASIQASTASASVTRIPRTSFDLASFVGPTGLNTVACALSTDDPSVQEKLKCINTKTGEPLPLPPLAHPTEVGLGGEHACVLDERKLKCWPLGSIEFNLVVANLFRPRQLRVLADAIQGVTYFVPCFLEAESDLRCIVGIPAEEGGKAPTFPPIEPASSLTTEFAKAASQIGYDVIRKHGVVELKSSAKSLCARYLDETVECLGGFYAAREDNSWAMWAKSLRHPRQLAFIGYFPCAADDSGINCFIRYGESNFFNKTIEEKGLMRMQVLDFSASQMGLCAVDQNRHVHCWPSPFYSNRSDEGWKIPDNLGPVEHIETRLSTTCAWRTEGSVRCWNGFRYNGFVSAPSILEPWLRNTKAMNFTFELDELKDQLERMAPRLPSYKNRFFRRAAEMLPGYEGAKDPSQDLAILRARLFVLYLIEGPLADIRTDGYRRDYEARFSRLRKEGDRKTGARSLSDLAPGYLETQAALGLALEALIASGGGEGVSANEELQKLIVSARFINALAQAPGTTSHELRARLRKELSQHKTLFKALAGNVSTRGFGEMLMSLEEYVTRW